MDIPLYEPLLTDEDRAAVQETLDSGWISPRGDEVARFEDEITRFLGRDHGLAVDSGTAALHLALASLGIGEGDEVLVPDFTFGAVGTVVRTVGAEPVLVDVEGETLGMDPAMAAEAVTADTAAVLVAHMFGHPADMDGIAALADREDLAVVEDAAQALGSTYHGELTGTVGDVGCFSFSWNKTLTTGKGGLVVTDTDNVFDRIRMTAEYGRDTQDRSSFVDAGVNYRMDNIRAALAREQFSRLDTLFERRKEIAGWYRERLDEHRVTVPSFPGEDRDAVPWMIYVLVEDEPTRDTAAAALDREGIGYRTFYRPLHTMDAFTARSDYPVSESVAGRGLMLPSGPGLSEEDVDTVCSVLNDVL
ncbi:MAG: DegT/DnrJ/EryC1/StrS family aminotransferase [Candidatus Nanohaloarchaea archaeon]